MKGWVHEREIEAGVRRCFPRVPPDDLAAIAQTEIVYVQSSAFDRACVCVREQHSRFGPEFRRRDAEHACATAEVDDSLRRLVSHESREGFEQELTAGIELLRAENTGQGFELKLEALSADGFDRGEKSRGILRLGSRASVLLEANDAGTRAIGDDDRRLGELSREAFDGRNHTKRIGAGKEELALGL
jgi:hypothetical protein